MKKYCISCGKNRPMFLYHKDDSKYQIKSNNGKCVECKICCYKRAKSQSGLMQRVDGKFAFVKMSKIEIIKYIVKR